MGATAAQARAALRQYKDVMQAAERYFEGKFDHIKEGDEDFVMLDDGEATRKSRFSATISEPEDKMTSDEEEDDDDDDADYIDYDSDFDDSRDTSNGVPAVDPYSGTDLHKAREDQANSQLLQVSSSPKTVARKSLKLKRNLK